MTAESSNILKNLNQVRQACVDAGYARPSYDRLNKAVDERALPQRRGGGWTFKTVMRWASTCLERVVDQGPGADTPAIVPIEEETNAAARAAADIEYKRAQTERVRFRLEVEKQKYLPREEVEMMLAGRAGVFKFGLTNMVQANAPDWVHLVGGKADRIRILQDAITACIDNLLDEYSRATFVVEIVPEDQATGEIVDGQ